MVLDRIVKVFYRALEVWIKQMKKNRKVQENIHLKQKFPNMVELPEICLFCPIDSCAFCI